MPDGQRADLRWADGQTALSVTAGPLYRGRGSQADESTTIPRGFGTRCCSDDSGLFDSRRSDRTRRRRGRTRRRRHGETPLFPGRRRADRGRLARPDVRAGLADRPVSLSPPHPARHRSRGRRARERGRALPVRPPDAGHLRGPTRRDLPAGTQRRALARLHVRRGREFLDTDRGRWDRRSR